MRVGSRSPMAKIADRGFRIADSMDVPPIRNPQSSHGFHVPLATAGTNRSMPAGGKSSVLPSSALLYAVIRSFTTSRPSSNVSSGDSRHFVRVFLARESPLLTFDDGLEVVKLLMTAYKSAEEGKTLDFPPAGIERFVPAVAKGTWKP